SSICVARIAATSWRASWATLSASSPSDILSLICKIGLASLVTSRPPGTPEAEAPRRSLARRSRPIGSRHPPSRPGFDASMLSAHSSHMVDAVEVSRSLALLLDLVVQEHLEDVEAREDLPEDLHLEGVAVGPLHGRHPRVQPFRERDVGLSRRVVRPELPVHHLPAPFLDELPRRDHLPAGALRLVHSCTVHPAMYASAPYSHTQRASG